MRRLVTAALSSTSLFAAAHGAAVTDGETQLIITMDLSDLDLRLEGLGNAEVRFTETDFFRDGQPVVQFPTTGGELGEEMTGRLEHEGSGIKLTSDGQFLSIENFTLDLDSDRVLADYSSSIGLSGEDAEFFSFNATGGVTTGDPFNDIDSTAFIMHYTESSVDLFNDVFAGSDPDDVLPISDRALFAVATTDPTNAIPVPSAALLAVPFFAAALMRRDRRQRGTAA